MISEFYFSAFEIFFMVSEFQFIQYEPGYVIVFFHRSTSSHAALGEGVLQYWYQSGVLRSLPYTHIMLGRVRICVRQLDKLAQ